MPPFNRESETGMVAIRESTNHGIIDPFNDNGAADPFDDTANIPPTKCETTAQNGDALTVQTIDDPETHASALEKLLDFSLCACSTASLSSALFKERTCSYCGDGCNKFAGYTKEVVHGKDGETTKVYLHKGCSQLKGWRDAHSQQYNVVLADLLAHFHAREVAEARRQVASTEEAVRQEALRREGLERCAEPSSRKASSYDDEVSDRAVVDAESAAALRRDTDTVPLDVKKLSMKKRVSSKLKKWKKRLGGGRGSTTVAATDEAAAADVADDGFPSTKKEKAMKRRVSKKLKTMKKGMKNLFGGCKGNRNAAVDEQATKQQIPSRVAYI